MMRISKIIWRKEFPMNKKENLLKALGPLAPLYDDPAVAEIMVNGPDSVVINKDRKLETTDLKFDSPEEISAIIEALLAFRGQNLDPSLSTFQMRLPDRNGKALVVMPPTAVEGPYLVLVKLPEMKLTWDMVLEFGALTQEGKDFIQQAIKDKVNILMAGGTNSGKTTMLNRLVDLIPHDQRVVVVEELRELQIDHPQAVYLEAGEPPHLSFEEAVFTSSIMRPDWLVFSEIYGPAGMSILEILSHGHTGMTTMHGNSAEEVLSRLETICLKHNPGLGPLEIRNLISAAFQLVIYMRQLSDGKRKVVEIVEICGVENGRYVLQRLFRFNPETYRLEATGAEPRWNEDF
jgi:pilus assembly protein CpaF